MKFTCPQQWNENGSLHLGCLSELVFFFKCLYFEWYSGPSLSIYACVFHWILFSSSELRGRPHSARDGDFSWCYFTFHMSVRFLGFFFFNENKSCYSAPKLVNVKSRLWSEWRLRFLVWLSLDNLDECKEYSQILGTDIKKWPYVELSPYLFLSFCTKNIPPKYLIHQKHTTKIFLIF